MCNFDLSCFPFSSSPLFYSPRNKAKKWATVEKGKWLCVRSLVVVDKGKEIREGLTLSPHVNFEEKELFLILYDFGHTKEKQEQTKFYDLRRGITEDFQRLAKFQRTFIKKYQKESLILSDLCF